MRATGRDWENAALAYLQQAGLELLARNFTTRLGEIDLVMRDRHAGVVFVEVRYRGAAARASAAASVGPAKRAKLLRAAGIYLQAHPLLADAECRFDVIACGGTLAQPTFDWIRGAFERD